MNSKYDKTAVNYIIQKYSDVERINLIIEIFLQLIINIQKN